MTRISDLLILFWGLFGSPVALAISKNATLGAQRHSKRSDVALLNITTSSALDLFLAGLKNGTAKQEFKRLDIVTPLQDQDVILTGNYEKGRRIKPKNYLKDCFEILKHGHFGSGIYYTRPHLRLIPLPVYCDMQTTHGGWTVLFRRTLTNNFNFEKNWTDYKRGFGKLNSDFWFGNDNMFLIASQKNYYLRFDFWLQNGTRMFLEYDDLSIDLEKNGYRIKVGDYISDFTIVNTSAKGFDNRKFSTPDSDPEFHQKCNRTKGSWWRRSCDDHILLTKDKEIVLNTGIQKLSFVKTEMKIRPIVMKQPKKEVKVAKPYIITVSINGSDCQDVQSKGYNKSGIYLLHSPPMIIYCELSDNDWTSGWLLLMRRTSIKNYFFTRNWKEYKYGFGSKESDFWIGNEYIFLLTNSRKYNLRMDLWFGNGTRRYIEYHDFKIDSEENGYRLHVSSYSSDMNIGTGPAMFFNSLKFSTYDKDNGGSGGSCAKSYNAGWWYNSCDNVHLVVYNEIRVFTGRWIYFKKAEMKIRRQRT